MPRSANAFGGPRWTVTRDALSLPVRFVPRLNPVTLLQPVYFALYRFLRVRGPILDLILSPVSPRSAGNTVILTVVDRFSKSAHFIPLPKLPSAKGTAQIMVDHVFKLHGLPTDIVSDRGPQFASQFWREFCRLIGASASLSSGFHPQTNGQAERANQIVVRIICSLALCNPSSWSEQLA